MPLGNYKVRVTLPYTTALPSDVAINDFSFGGGTGSAYADLDDAIQRFYLDVGTGVAGGNGNPVAEYLSDCLNRNTNMARTDVYDRAAPGDPPVYSSVWTLGPNGGGSEFPAEVQTVLSFKMTGSFTPAEKRRRRGRVFLGPVTAQTSLSASDLLYLDGGYIRDVLSSAKDYLGDQASGDGWVWEVWSGLDATGYAINLVSMDNAFDTLRSRGPAPTGRIQASL